MDQDLKQGANYQILIQYDEFDTENTNPVKHVLVHKITDENELHIFLLLPQFVIMTAGEIMFSITSLQFSFTQVSAAKVLYLFIICFSAESLPLLALSF